MALSDRENTSVINYFNSKPYVLDLMVDKKAYLECQDSFRTDNLQTLQAKYDSWKQDFEMDKDVKLVMYMYNYDKDVHEKIDYNGNVIE